MTFGCGSNASICPLPHLVLFVTKVNLHQSGCCIEEETLIPHALGKFPKFTYKSEVLPNHQLGRNLCDSDKDNRMGL